MAVFSGSVTGSDRSGRVVAASVIAAVSNTDPPIIR
jgi:hypothetical protein